MKGFSLSLGMLALSLWLSVVAVGCHAREETRTSRNMDFPIQQQQQQHHHHTASETIDKGPDKLFSHQNYNDEFSFLTSTGTNKEFESDRGRNLYEETTYKSWTQRMGESLWGVLFGIVLSFVAPIVLFWNEGRAVKRTKQIQYISENTVEIKSARDLAEGVGPGVPAGQLIHIVGRAEPSTQNIEGMGVSLQDPVFGIPPISSEINHELLVLTRNVQMLQWVEHSSSTTRKTAGGGEETTTTYDYDKQWHAREIDSSMFHDSQYQYSNPSMQYKSQTFYTPSGAQLNTSLIAKNTNNEVSNQYYSADNVIKEGHGNNNNSIIQMSDQLLHQITPDTAYNTMGKPPPLPTNLIGGNSGGDAAYGGGYGSLSPSKQQPPSSGLDSPRWTNNTTLEIGPQPADIGTHRLDWKYCKSTIVSVLAKHSSYTNSLVEWHHPTDTDFTCCRLQVGEHTLQDMCRTMTTENTILTWILRVVGFVLWMIAFRMIAQPLEVLLDLGTIPAFGLEPGTIVSYLTGFGSFLLALCLSLIVIAVAWIVYRPVLAILLIVASIGLFLLLPKPQQQSSSSSESGGGDGSS